MSDKSTKELPDDRFISLLIDKNIDIEGRTLVLEGEVGSTDFCLRNVNAALSLFEKKSKKKNITIKIFSFGGCFYETLAIIGRIKSSPCSITTIVYGAAMSGGALVLLAGNVRKMAEDSVIMLHESSYGIGGGHQSVKDFTLQADKENKWMIEFLIANSTADRKFWESKINRKDFYISAEEAIDLGIVDKLI